MSTTTLQTPPAPTASTAPLHRIPASPGPSPAQTTGPQTITAECTECAAVITADVALPGEILDCASCGAELEVRSITPPFLVLAPQAEEDWGE